MPVFDQYEVESSSTYSGSFSDQVMFGELFVNAETLVTGYTPLGDPNPQTSRRSITSRIAGRESTSPNINNMWMPGYIIDGYASGSWLGRQQRFQSIFSDETWLDSYMPDPVELATTANVTTGAIGFGSGSVAEISGSMYGIYPFPFYPNVDIAISFGTRGPRAPSSLIQDQLQWENSFPFESRFKTIQRIFKFDSRLPKKYTLNNLLPGTTPVSPPSSSNLLSSVITTFFSQPPSDPNFRYNINILCGYMNWPGTVWPIPSAGAANDHHLIFGTAPVFESYKLLFGTGKGFTSGSGITTSGPSLKIGFSFQILISSNNYKFNYCYAVEPRGYKYGIRSVAPEQTKCVYRLGRYGQFRDTLEGRPTVATYVTDTINTITNVKIKRTFFYPIEINFVSGSKIYTDAIDYVTATNPDYNPYDSGIYDKYYRSGQPYFDRDNED